MGKQKVKYETTVKMIWTKHNFIWRNCKVYRDYLMWRNDRKYLKWLEYAKDKKLHVNITGDWLDTMINKYDK